VSVQKFLAASLGLKAEQLFVGGRYHNLSDMAKLPVKKKELYYPDLEQLKPIHMQECGDIFTRIEQKDVLLHFPYDSYNPVLTFFNQAAIDPDVSSIYVTLYRVAADSHIVNALISAAKNKKEVMVFVELKARFDEANNIRWSKEMEKAGVKIIYSIPRIKVHSKIALVQKQTAAGTKSYAYVGTGNFNETTARFYTDHALFTTDSDITTDLQTLFQFLKQRTKPVRKAGKEFGSILVSQYNMTDIFEQEINAQIKRKKKGLPASIKIKLNNLEDIPMIDQLYKASRAGVHIQLIVRGICCLKSGEKELSENIEIKRIVDRFLEHSRIFIFGENGTGKVYMGSSDWMTRNLHHRIEVCVPVREPDLAKQLKDYFDIQWSDNVKAASTETPATFLKNEHSAINGAIKEEARCSQQLIYTYLKNRT
jgi:polyphosphate kinase